MSKEMNPSSTPHLTLQWRPTATVPATHKSPRLPRHSKWSVPAGPFPASVPQANPSEQLSYVALLWIAWGIFTRIDETEHLRPPASLRNAAHVASHAAHYAQSALHDGERGVEDGLRGAWDGYEGMKRSDDGVYSLAFPRTPTTTGHTGPEASRGWIATAFFGITKVFTYAIVYPSIAIFNAASFILHYLSITFFMFLTSAYYLSWPLHQLLSTILGTLSAPLSLLTALIRYTEPLWTLAGGLIGASATLGGAFAWIGNKADVRIQEVHEHRIERQRLEALERELARERERADEQERRARAMAAAAADAAMYPGRRIPARVEPRSLLSVIVDKVFGRVSVQDEYEAYYADLELLEPRALAQAVAWRNGQRFGEGFGIGDEDERDGIRYTVRAGSRLMIASADPGSKRRHARRPSATRTVAVPQQVMHHHYRGPVRHAQQPLRGAYIPDLHHHIQDDALPAIHTPPMDGLPPTPRKSLNSAGYAGQAPFMTFPTGSLVRGGRGGADRAASSGGRRIMFEDEVERIAREEVENEPVEGEVFGLEDDDEEDVMAGDGNVQTFDHDHDQDDVPPAGPSSLHIHYHHNPPSATSNRRKRSLRFDESQGAPTFSGGAIDHAHLGDKYGTPFKRSSARAVRGAQQAFEGGEQVEDGEDGPAGVLFGQGVGLRERESEMEL